jgi:Arc/MetJ-type ribon-helix-helix transcriptional regulator
MEGTPVRLATLSTCQLVRETAVDAITSRIYTCIKFDARSDGGFMPQALFNNQETVRTTVTLPASLLKRSQKLIDSGEVPNRNVLIVSALERLLAELERAEIDRQFAAMADDAVFQKLQTEMAESFEASDWEALLDGEQTLE